MNTESKRWTEGLQEETRQALEEMRINPDGKLYFKNRNGGGAYMTAQDLMNRKLTLTDRESGQVSNFEDVEELLDSAWAVD